MAQNIHPRCLVIFKNKSRQQQWQVQPQAVCKMAKVWSKKHCKQADIHYDAIFTAWECNPYPLNHKIDWEKQWMDWIRYNIQWLTSTPMVLGMVPDEDVSRAAKALGCTTDDIFKVARKVSNTLFVDFAYDWHQKTVTYRDHDPQNFALCRTKPKKRKKKKPPDK